MKVVSNTVGPMTKAFGLLVKGISVALYPLQFLADVFLSPIQLVLGGIAQLVGTVADNIKKDFIGRLIPDKKIKQVVITDTIPAIGRLSPKFTILPVAHYLTEVIK